MPDLNLLLRLLLKSAGMAHRRATGLMEFDWRMLTPIACDGPLTLSDLISTLDRNKSQVSRALARLVDLGLVERRREKGVPSIVLQATPAGQATFDLISDEARRRDATLIEQLTIREQRSLMSILDRLTHNALGLLAREREIAEAEARAKRAAPRQARA
jgi:DNA-binding MarR family transcriptional regulator